MCRRLLLNPCNMIDWKATIGIFGISYRIFAFLWICSEPQTTSIWHTFGYTRNIFLQIPWRPWEYPWGQCSWWLWSYPDLTWRRPSWRSELSLWSWSTWEDSWRIPASPLMPSGMATSLIFFLDISWVFLNLPAWQIKSSQAIVNSYWQGFIVEPFSDLDHRLICCSMN